MWKEICRAHWTSVLLLLHCHVPAEMKWERFLSFFVLLPLFTAPCPTVCRINGQRRLTVTDILLSFSFFFFLFFLPSSYSLLFLFFVKLALRFRGSRNEARKEEKEWRTFIPAAALWPSSTARILFFHKCCRHGSLSDVSTRLNGKVIVGEYISVLS